MNILVAGINGFVGHHVARTLSSEGHSIIGLGSQPEAAADLSSIVDRYYGFDMTNAEEVSTLNLEGVDAIINLAGFAKVGESIGQGELYNRVNVGVHTVLYEECLRQNVSPRVIAISTGAVYDPRQKLPITEASQLIDDDKTNEYTISKKLMERAVLGYSDLGLDCIIVRPFNHSGPGQMPGFLIPDLGEQITDAAKNNTPLMVGNLKTKRDYTDVRDVARAYTLLATIERSKLHHRIYNICSGTSVIGEDILQMMMEAFAIEGLEVNVDPKKIRPNDVMEIYGSRARMTQDTGWEPEIPVKQMIADYAAWKQGVDPENNR